MTPIPFGGGLVLFDAPRQQLRVLNSGAAAIWTLIDSGLSAEETTEAIATHAGLTPDEAAIHVDVISWLWDAPPESIPVAPPALSPREISDPGRPKLYSVLGTGFGFSSDDEETRLRVELALSDCAEAAAAPLFLLHVAAEEQGEMRLLKDGEAILASSDGGEMAGAVFQAILEGVHVGVDWLGLMHGAAVALDGGAVLIPGASGSGKSTLAAYLAARGADYLADDLIALRDDGYVVPWPTPLSIKRGSWPVLGPLYPELDRLEEINLLDRRIKFVPVGRAPWSRPPARAKAIVFPEYSDVRRASAEPVAPLDALVRLAQERLWIGCPMAEEKLRRFLDWLGDVPAYRIVYRHLDEAERQMAQIMEDIRS